MTVKELSETAGVSGEARALAQDDSTPAGYLDALEKKELYQDAIRFLAYKMPTDAGIKWSTKCVKELRSPEAQAQKDEELAAAEAWVKAPTDPNRRAAKSASDNSKKKGPSTMLAMAVYMSGGSLSPPGGPEIPPPKLIAQTFIVGAVQGVVLSHEPSKATERYKKALAMGKEFDKGAPLPGK